MAPRPAGLESPSLSASPDVPAYELKFLLTEAQAKEVEVRAAGRLAPDPHADPALGGAYETTSLYCDTAQFDVFHRTGAFKRRKHRLRRYSTTPWIFLERKSKWGDRVEKRRTMVPGTDLALFAGPASATTWPGHWFHRHLMYRQLAPVCRIAYERVAFMGETADGPLRLTFDRNIRGVFTPHWCLAGFEGGLPVLTGGVVCEFKYRAYLPGLFKEIIQAMRLTPGPVSKYRAFLRASGRVGERSTVDAGVA